MSSEKINMGLSEAEERLSENTIDNIGIAIRSIEKIESFNSNYQDVVSRIRECYYELQESLNDISGFKEDLYYDEEEQNEVENRLDLIKSLKRKYGNNIKEILEYKNKVEEEIEKIENMESYINSLKINLEKVQNKMCEISLEMNKIRTNYSEKLSCKINKELKELEMKNAKFNIKIDFSEENNFNKNGLDKVEFMISTNVGEEEKSLIKIASGGEMSRIMLAIKSVLADVDETPIVIFDEIDTGISGKAANSTGEKMKKISKKHQVLCVTHLASIAAKGDYNYFVSKKVENGKTKTHIKKLNENELLEEIARISSGTVSTITINHAKELRKMSLKNIA